MGKGQPYGPEAAIGQVVDCFWPSPYNLTIQLFDELVKSRNYSVIVIPAKAGIQ